MNFVVVVVVVTTHNTSFQINSAFAWLNQELDSSDKDYQLFAANAVYVDRRLKLLNPYSDVVSGCFKSKSELVDFDADKEKVKKEINQWVERQTNKKIKDLIKKFPPLTRMVLVNAIYFKAEWFDQFGQTFQVTIQIFRILFNKVLKITVGDI